MHDPMEVTLQGRGREGMGRDGRREEEEGWGGDNECK